jgi:hypothetical protein
LQSAARPDAAARVVDALEGLVRARHAHGPSTPRP